MNELRCVLVIRVQHDHDIGPDIQCLLITGLLVASITFIYLVLYDMFDAKPMCLSYGLIWTVIVHEHNIIHYIKWYFFIGPLYGPRCLISRKYYNYFLSVQHLNQK